MSTVHIGISNVSDQYKNWYAGFYCTDAGNPAREAAGMGGALNFLIAPISSYRFC
jgi:hypothetical protein